MIDSGLSHFFGRLYNFIILSLLLLSFGYISLRMYFPSIELIMTTIKGFKAIGCVIAGILALWLIYKYIICNINGITIGIVISVLFFMLLALQILSIVYLRVIPSWDFGDIMQGSGDIAKGNHFSYREYFEMYPHNIGPAMLLGYFKRLAGYIWGPYILNVLFIDISILTAFVIIKRVFDIRLATLMLFLCLFTTPLYLYAPIVYTDTLSMPFPIMTLYFLILAGEAIKKGHKVRCILLFGLIGGLSAVGYLIKPIAAIGLAAAIAEVIFGRNTGREQKEKVIVRQKGWWKVLSLVISVVVFVGVIQSFTLFEDFTGYSDGIPSEKTFPYTHWLAMGMNKPWKDGGTSDGYGGFSGPDVVDLQESATYKQKEEISRKKIEERLSAFGKKGYIKFLLQKFEWTWTDGTYYAPEKLRREPIKLTKIHDYILLDKTKTTNIFYLRLAQIAHSINMLFILIGGFFAIRGRMHPMYRIMAVMCLGIMIFLLFWETRSRYLTFLIPVFLMMSVIAMNTAFHWLEETMSRLKHK